MPAGEGAKTRLSSVIDKEITADTGGFNSPADVTGIIRTLSPFHCNAPSPLPRLISKANVEKLISRVNLNSTNFTPVCLTLFSFATVAISIMLL